jgi:phosphatidate phosphatase LPIN
MNLKRGPNRVTFTVTSELQGTKQVSSTLYLWTQEDNIVVSDIDGTITK